jgi:hypothetical protein
MPPKPSKRLQKPANDIMSTWPSPNAYDTANINPEHRLNATDHGFNHLGIPNPIVSAAASPAQLTRPTFTHAVDEKKYLYAMTQKLALVRAFIYKEIELKLDPLRRMNRDATSQVLCKPPITFTFYAQEVVRDLVKLRKEIEEVARKEGRDAEKLQGLGYEFLWAWKELRGILVGLVPGKREVRRGRAERVMEGALGECLVEEDEGDDEGEGDGEGEI